MNTTSTAALNKSFFGMTYCTISYRVRDGNICRISEDGITGDETIAEFIPATAENLAAFDDIESKYGCMNLECFAAAEEYFADNGAVRVSPAEDEDADYGLTWA